MAARGYEFYLRVLKVSLTSERRERVRHTLSFLSILFGRESHSLITTGVIPPIRAQKHVKRARNNRSVMQATKRGHRSHEVCDYRCSDKSSRVLPFIWGRLLCSIEWFTILSL